MSRMAKDALGRRARRQFSEEFKDGAVRDVFVLPATGLANARVGERPSVYGVILRMPNRMAPRLKGPGTINDDIYVSAMQIGS